MKMFDSTLLSGGISKHLVVLIRLRQGNPRSCSWKSNHAEEKHSESPRQSQPTRLKDGKPCRHIDRRRT